MHGELQASAGHRQDGKEPATTAKLEKAVLHSCRCHLPCIEVWLEDPKLMENGCFSLPVQPTASLSFEHAKLKYIRVTVSPALLTKARTTGQVNWAGPGRLCSATRRRVCPALSYCPRLTIDFGRQYFILEKPGSMPLPHLWPRIPPLLARAP